MAVGSTQAVRWIVPEHYRFGFRLATPYDVFAFGMTIYQVLTGLVSLHNEEHRDIIKDWIKDGEVPDRPEDNRVPKSVWQLFEDCISKGPAKRPSLKEVNSRLNHSLPQWLRRRVDHYYSAEVLRLTADQTWQLWRISL
ncbi:hypothetical protein EDD86DRAFT_65885 [Gorgonomyces haynaldii]|nr:hypothetical protein EDD86DRAFT_65885 [Gorgonomyces haynaldii]